MDGKGTVVIVSRNNLHLTKRAVASAFAQDTPCQVLLIDNASVDGTPHWAKTVAGLATVLLEEQLSLAACWNLGLREAYKHTDHALVCNNDIEVLPSTYRHLLNHGGEFVTCVSVDNREQFHEPTATGWSPRPHPDFSCFLIWRGCWELAGKFDEAYYPAYAEDADMHVRMHRAGINAVCIDVPFLHHGAQTVKHANPAERLKIQRGADQNRKRFKAKYGVEVGGKEYYALFSVVEQT